MMSAKGLIRIRNDVGNLGKFGSSNGNSLHILIRAKMNGNGRGRSPDRHMNHAGKLLTLSLLQPGQEV